MGEKFKQILDTINPEILENPQANLVEEGIIDSLAIMQIVSALEQEYGIEFDPDDVTPETFASAQTIWNALQGYLKA